MPAGSLVVAASEANGAILFFLKADWSTGTADAPADRAGLLLGLASKNRPIDAR
jgi:hypothetical protein